MSDPVPFRSQAALLSDSIEDEVEKIRAREPLELVRRDSRLVQLYVQKIEGTYNVGRAKTDTDNAIDLLYIAYNTTPQEEGEIRVKISAIMDKLILAQGESERTMADAMRTATNVISVLDDMLPVWLDAREEQKADLVKAFVTGDLLELATDIKTRATAIKDRLLRIAESYDRIIVETASASEVSERALGRRLIDQQALQDEIDEANAEREQLDSLVRDLREEVQKFEARARQYEERATTAEQRAFIMQIVKIGAQVVAAAIPPIAMAAGGAATGGASVIAASTLNTLRQTTEAGGEDEGAGDTPKPDVTAETIQTKKDIAQTKKELTLAEKKVGEIEDRVEGLRRDLTKAQEEDETQVDADTSEEAVEQPTDGEAVKAIRRRLKEAKTELEAAQKKTRMLVGVLSGLQDSLKALAQGLGELSQAQKDEAAGLREIQMRMLDKAEAYERERREQAAKLVRITALMKGKLSKDETIKLAIKSLNISLSALKRTKEIVEEIAFFFKSFADFMDQVAEEANNEIARANRVAAGSSIGRAVLRQLIKTTDGFFIRQSGQWRAVYLVSDAFNRSFAEGRSKLNRLSGKYITGDELTAYLQAAAVLLRKIADERDDASKARLLLLEESRAALYEKATKESA
ncbi:tyrosyl-tRNA deacylase [Caulobacter soli]|uniref:tyrosyl-tRNA deacylase n=1 Tax=Caulobacter soli TaxID=2708539 RepID=UPI0013EA4439|nr:tyrosyl-tRNA deacylase [Caulobacter soli]